jgi:hypothetical protein
MAVNRFDERFKSNVPVISRVDWGARDPHSPYVDNDPSKIVIHHSGSSLSSNWKGDVTIRAIQRFHQWVDGKVGGKVRWKDIGYHYLIGPDGSIWQGRPEWAEGGHARSWNPNSLGIMVYGMYDKEQIGQPAYDSLVELIGDIRGRHEIGESAIRLHNEEPNARRIRKTCPGSDITQRLGAIRTASSEVLAQMTDRGVAAETDSSRTAGFIPQFWDDNAEIFDPPPPAPAPVGRQVSVKPKPSDGSFAVVGLIIAVVILILSQLIGD